MLSTVQCTLKVEDNEKVGGGGGGLEGGKCKVLVSDRSPFIFLSVRPLE